MKIGRCMLMALAVGCGAADATDTEKAPLPPGEAQGQPAAPAAQETAADTRCPLALPGAQVSSEVTSDGIALVFRVAGGDPTDLRDRVQRMADHHNAAQVPGDGRAGKDQKSGGMTSGASAQGMDMHGGAKKVPSRAVVEETAGGARIVFTPADPAQVGLLREQIRVHGKEMATTGCAADEAPTPQAPPPSSSGDSQPAPKPTPSPKPADPILPDRPVTPDQPVTPPVPPPPPTGEPFVQ